MISLPPSTVIFSISIAALYTISSSGIWRFFQGNQNRRGEKMKFPVFALISCLVLLFCSTSAYAKTRSPPSPTPTPTPAPAPAPHFVNLTELLTVAGPFHTFLDYLISTKVIDTFQHQANDTEEGITLFVPKDGAFQSLKKPSLSNLTQDQLKQLCLFHALPHFYSLADFKNLSESGPIMSFAGGPYSLNFTDDSGTVHLYTGWTRTKVSSAVYSTDPVAVYQVDKLLLPEAIFGTDIPPMPAPAPAPVKEISPAADTPSSGSSADVVGSSPKSSPKNSGHRTAAYWGICGQFALAISGVLMLFL